MRYSEKPERTIFLLVTCSPNEARNKLAIEVAKNLKNKLSEINQGDRLIVFDNASKHLDHLEYIHPSAVVCLSDFNIGFWAAIKWVLDNLARLNPGTFDFIYIIESDLIHTDLSKLGKCESMLDQFDEISSVRTQEFSVKQRWRYDKKLRFLPFHIERSEVSLRNVVTNERAKFVPVNEVDDFYISNIHPKVPSLHRIDIFNKVINKLSCLEGFTELDYCKETINLKAKVGVLDGGIYYEKFSWSEREGVVSGSYSSDDELRENGYLNTRKSSIEMLPNMNVKIFTKLNKKHDK